MPKPIPLENYSYGENSLSIFAYQEALKYNLLIKAIH